MRVQDQAYKTVRVVGQVASYARLSESIQLCGLFIEMLNSCRIPSGLKRTAYFLARVDGAHATVMPQDDEILDSVWLRSAEAQQRIGMAEMMKCIVRAEQFLQARE